MTASPTGGEKTGSSRRAYWLVAKQETGPTAPLTVTLPGGAEALPIFSFEEEAKVFLWFAEYGDGWFAFEVSSDELISLLFGSHAVAENVALDPSPEILAELAVSLVTLSRERFVGHIMLGSEPPREGAGSPRPFQGESWLAPGSPSWLPPGYNLDGSDPDILLLRRWDSSTVAAFSARGATKEGLREAAEADSGLVLR